MGTKNFFLIVGGLGGTVAVLANDLVHGIILGVALGVMIGGIMREMVEIKKSISK